MGQQVIAAWNLNHPTQCLLALRKENTVRAGFPTLSRSQSPGLKGVRRGRGHNEQAHRYCGERAQCAVSRMVRSPARRLSTSAATRHGLLWCGTLVASSFSALHEIRQCSRASPPPSAVAARPTPWPTTRTPSRPSTYASTPPPKVIDATPSSPFASRFISLPATSAGPSKRCWTPSRSTARARCFALPRRSSARRRCRLPSMVASRSWR